MLSCLSQALVPVRENSLMLRYIPDPTEPFLDGDFQPAPGKQGLKVMPGYQPVFMCAGFFNALSDQSVLVVSG